MVPTALIERLPNVCVFDRFFGVDCLGCGMTRALSTALHGDWAAAQSLNPLAGFVLLFALAWFAADAMLLVDRRRRHRA